MIVVSDTSPLSYLRQIGRPNLLADLFGNIIIPPAVLAEWRCDTPVERELLQMFPWVKVVAPRNTVAVEQLEQELDRGEAEAIVVAEELHAELLVIDEKDGREVAERRGLTITGLLGVLLRSKRRSLLPLIRPDIERLLTQTNFHAEQALVNKVLHAAGEPPLFS